MKFIERLFEMFLIFILLIQIDAIVGGYESEPHRNALISRIFIPYGSYHMELFEIQHLVALLINAGSITNM